MSKSPRDDDAVEQHQIARAVGDLFDLPAAWSYCIIGHHYVESLSVRVSPNGTNVCAGCAATPAGARELETWDERDRRLFGFRRKKLK
jgi:hypothetical protein